ncbi:MAG: hypothetical protein IKA61_04220 [Clostridia bacterium]|nr:hypothetical protein [Clostridia bacterium]
MKANKNAMAKIFLCFALVLSLFGATFAWLHQSADSVKASEVIAMDDKISITYSEENAWIQVDFDGFTAEWNSWHDADSDVFSANNGVDPLEFTYVNGRPLRELYNENNSLFEAYTETDWIEAYAVYIAESVEDYTIQLKAGFTIVGKDGNAYVLQNDTKTYGWVDGTFGVIEVEAPAEPIDYTDYLGIEDRTSWASGGHADIVTFGLMDFSITEGNQYFKSSVSGCWYYGNNDVIPANNGVDILEYIYLNGASARSLIDANSVEGKTTADTIYWLNNPAAWPIAFETGTDCWIRVDKTAFDGNFTFTIKEGFTIIRNDGQVITVKDDIVYSYADGALSAKTILKKYTLTFEGVEERKVLENSAIGELPTVPERAGYIGTWTIDGAPISESTVYSYGENKTAVASYALDYTDYLGIEDRTSWASGGHADIVSFGLMDFSITEGNQYFKSSVSGCWYKGNADVITANNGIDILEYVYLNGVSARSLIDGNTEGKSTADTAYWLSNSAAWPIAFETGTDCWIRIDKTAFDGGNFTITIKAGFTIIRNDGQIITTTSDIIYNYSNGVLGSKIVDKAYTLSFEGTDVTKQLKSSDTIGELPAVPEREGYTGVWTIDGVEITADTCYTYGADKTATVVYSKDITDTIGLGDWGVPETESDIRYLWIRDNNADIATAYPSSYWNDHEDNKDSNFGIDIMQYVLIDGESVRDIINANAAGTTSYAGATTFPLNLGGCYAPICIETAGDGIRFKVLVSYKTSFEVTFKAGFTLISNGIKLYTTEDVVYRVGETMNDIVRPGHKYTLSFEGVDTTKKLEVGEAIGELPAVPEREGYTGIWVIDGTPISASTAYNYGANKTATVLYTEIVEMVDVTDRISFEERTSWGADAGEVYIAMLLDGSYLNTAAAINGAWHADNDAIIPANRGVDIMQYIYVNGLEARTLIEDNYQGDKKGNACACWLSNPAAYPVYVETTEGSGIMMRFATAEFGTCITVTVKAGFTVTTLAGDVITVTEDVNFLCNNGVVSKAHLLSFESSEGDVDPIYVGENQPMSNLPAVPEKEGYAGVWSIDGVDVNSQSVFTFTEDKVAVARYVQKYFTLSFECDVEDVDSIQVELGAPISNLPAVPQKVSHEGWWTLDGQKITEETVYIFAEDKVAVATYLEVVDISDRIGIEDRTWGVHSADELYVALLDNGITNIQADGSENHWFNTDASVTGCWYVGNDAIIAANGGLDILEYIYINGRSAREILIENTGLANPIVCCDCWLSNPAASPIYVETSIDSGLMIRFAKAYTGTEFSITIKAGFTIMNASGQKVFLSKDVDFKYQQGKIAKAHTLSFEGADADVESIVVGYNLPMINLPAVPERDGYAGRWLIDGAPVTAESLYEFDCDKVAVAEYYQKYYTLSFEGAEIDPITVEVEVPMSNLPEIPERDGYIAYWTIDGEKVDATTVFNFAEDKVAVATYLEIVDIKDTLSVSDWGSPTGMDDLTFIRLGITTDENGTLIIPTPYDNVHWNDHPELAEGNFGCDIMAYIYINGVSVRELVSKNANGDTSYVGTTFPFDIGGVYAPIDVYTNYSDFTIWVLKDFADRGEFEITFKAGFMLMGDPSLSVVYTVSEDLTFYYKEISGSNVLGRDFTLAFEGTEDSKVIFVGDLIGELPEVPAKEGYVGVWTIGGEEITAETAFYYSANVIATPEYAPIDYTITINRANGDVEELTFNDLTKAEVLATITLTADNLFYSYSWQEALPETLELRDYTIIEVATELPASTRIISYSLTISATFDMNVFVEVVGDVPTVKFVLGDREEIVEGLMVSEGKYLYKLTNISASDLATEFTATVLVGGEEVDCVAYSVEAYLNKLVSGDVSEDLKTLIADVIAYAQAVEEYVGVEAGIQSIDGLVASEYVDLTQSDSKQTESKDESATITRVFVDHAMGCNNINVVFAIENIDNVTVLVNGVAAYLVEFEEGMGIYTASIGTWITNASVRYTVEVFVGEEKVQTLKYSVKSYLYEIQFSEEDPMSHLLKLAYNLSLSAKAYSEGV